ncbi:MAG: UDP-3-O-(3-hydroxymyristoyl)glucosamine N-acyltransferase [Leptospira sp.]|nr:UDP-3-O-(3-hydroxymyristoyl)glucosamine N-acyltransferase [Leptospira sp.]
MNLMELAEKLGLKFKGDPAKEIEGVKDLEHPAPASPGHIYFVETKKHFNKYTKARDVQIALTIEALSEHFENAIIAEPEEARLKFISLLSIFEKRSTPKKEVSPTAYIHPTAKVGKNVSIMHNVVLMENTIVGDNCIIYPNVVLEEGAQIGSNSTLMSGVVIGYNCILGENNLIHANTVIGADGFGFYDKAGVRYKIPQIGNVIIGNDVEMGACCTVDRAAIESTLVGNFTKFDDHVHIGHNCRVGNYVFIAGATVLAGSVILEDRVIIGGQSAVAEHLRMKKGSVLLGMSALTFDSKENTIYFGIPALPAIEMHRIHSLFPKLPELFRRIKKFEVSEL